MVPTLPDGAGPLLMAPFRVALGLLGLSLGASLVRPAWGRGPAALAAVALLAGLAIRGHCIAFLPLTNKFESFSAAALGVATAAVLAWRPSRAFGAFATVVAAAFLAAALSFPKALSYPPPLMNTVWYFLHVPLSFLAYGIWTVAAGAALAWALEGRDPAWLPRIHRLALQGLGLWSASMICGGVWGVLAWGAYFLWDPKVIWSVILWFHYATFVHVRLTPSLRSRPWVGPVMAGLGFLFVLVAYVGTSFFFGRSSHAFG